MAEIIRTILVMSVSGSIIALLLFALKPLIKNRLPKSAQYYLWLIVVAALIVPVSRFIIFESPINPMANTYAMKADIPDGISAIDAAVYASTAIADAGNGGLGLTTVSLGKLPDGTNITTELSHSQVWVLFFSHFWAIGAIAVFLYHLLAYALFLRKTRRNSVRADVDCKISVYFNTKATTPMLVGLFRPKIVLPEREYSDAQLQAVLLHELTHLRRKDVLIKWLSCLACAVHWFNPIVWLVRREIDRACELSCDEAVIAKLDASGRQTYGDTLIYVAADHKPRTALAMSESGRNLKERLGAIMKGKKWSRPAMIIGTTALLIAGIGAAIALGAGSKDSITFDLSSTDRIVLRSGSTGNVTELTKRTPESYELKRAYDVFDGNEFTREKSSKDHTGWSYRLQFYDGDKLIKDITVMDENTIDYGGYFWTANRGRADLEWFDELLGEKQSGMNLNASYTNPDYGFSIAFPDSWTDKASIEYQNDNFGERFEISSPQMNIGPVAYIDVYAKSVDWEANVKAQDVPYKYLGENSEYVFVRVLTTDLPLDPNDEDASELFMLMQDDILAGNYTFTAVEPSGATAVKYTNLENIAAIQIPSDCTVAEATEKTYLGDEISPLVHSGWEAVIKTTVYNAENIELVVSVQTISDETYERYILPTFNGADMTDESKMLATADNTGRFLSHAADLYPFSYIDPNEPGGGRYVAVNGVEQHESYGQLTDGRQYVSRLGARDPLGKTSVTVYAITQGDEAYDRAQEILATLVPINNGNNQS
jgi:beta-lactamase regulating signal transducer with metallopeptidase domain